MVDKILHENLILFSKQASNIYHLLERYRHAYIYCIAIRIFSTNKYLYQ